MTMIQTDIEATQEAGNSHNSTAKYLVLGGKLCLYFKTQSEKPTFHFLVRKEKLTCWFQECKRHSNPV